MKRLTAYVGFVTLLFSAEPGLCFYNPSTGSWMSRDPIEQLLMQKRLPGNSALLGRPGAAQRLLVAPVAARGSGLTLAGRDQSTYAFLNNEPVAHADPLGLFTVDYPALDPLFKSFRENKCNCWCKQHASFMVCFPSNDGSGLPDCHNYTEDNLPFHADDATIASGLTVDEPLAALLWPYWEIVTSPHFQQCTRKCDCDCFYLGRGKTPGLCSCDSTRDPI